jgi:hypothetical protein
MNLGSLWSWRSAAKQSDWHLNITCNFLYCDHQVHGDFLITLYMGTVVGYLVSGYIDVSRSVLPTFNIALWQIAFVIFMTWLDCMLMTAREATYVGDDTIGQYRQLPLYCVQFVGLSIVRCKGRLLKWEVGFISCWGTMLRKVLGAFWKTL